MPGTARSRRLLRYLGLVLTSLVLGACHASYCNFTAGPVPTSKLPLEEPLTYATDGSLVPEQHGLLASYFGGTSFDRLDHQQIDPQVDVVWSMSNPPVPNSYDTNELTGDRWPIWSVAWEGYLDVPAEGDYRLATTSDDGSWVQLKDGSGNLVTVVDNGGRHEPLTVTSVVHLLPGRQYIRVSYFQGPCCGAEMHLLWQPPGAPGLQVVPSQSLWTQGTRRPVIFVPGIGGSELNMRRAGSATFTTSDGKSRTENYGAGQLVWLDLWKALTDAEYFDLLRFTSDGAQPQVADVSVDGKLLTLPGTYGDVEAFFTGRGYVKDRTFFTYAYDWRSPVESHANDLDGLVQQALTASGSQSVDIVAHSMGSMVTRSWLLTGQRRSHAAHVVLLGGPHLGTPRGSFALIGGVCVSQIGPICLIPAQTEQYIFRTLPGGIELATSPAYYSVFQGQDSKHPLAYVDARKGAPPADYALMRNRELAAKAAQPALDGAEAYHATDLSFTGQVPGKLALVAGVNQCTLGQIREYTTTQQWPPLIGQVKTVDAFDFRALDGDGTVVRQSAALVDPAIGFQANAGAPVYYRQLEHGALASTTGLQTALELIRDQPADRGSVGSPSCSGFSVHSPMEFVLTDSAGQRLGAPGPTASPFREVPHASYDRFLDMKVALLGVPDRYQATLSGTANGDATIRIRTISGGNVATEVIFRHVPTTPAARGTLSFDAASGTVGDLSMDVDGDGTNVVTMHPDTLAGPAAEDTEPPVLSNISPAAGQAVVGTFPVGWTATDALSGVARSFAVVDATGTARLLMAPGALSLAPGQHTLDVYAEDRAANLATQQVTFTADAFEWLPPLPSDGSAFVGNAGRTIPVKLRVTTPTGQFVADRSVSVELLDAQGRPAVGPLLAATTPAAGVVIQGDQYHADLDTRGLAAGSYTLRVRFSSASLLGQLSLPVALR